MMATAAAKSAAAAAAASSPSKRPSSLENTSGATAASSNNNNPRGGSGGGSGSGGSGGSNSNNGNGKRIELAGYFFTVIVLFGVLTLVFNSQYATNVIQHDLSIMEQFLKDSVVDGSSLIAAGGITKLQQQLKQQQQQQQQHKDPSDIVKKVQEWANGKVDRSDAVVERIRLHDDADESYRLAGLNCDKYGGPPEAVAKEMVYWEDIPADSNHMSPLKKPHATEYLTFEPDGGGWNNIRMAMETILAIAFAMGRTLVLPPEDKMYLLSKGKTKDGEEQRKHFSFNHFFNMEAIHNEHNGLDIISTEEYLKREAMAGKLRDRSGNVVFPPGNRTNWDGDSKLLYAWLRQVAYVPVWQPDNCLAAFPATRSKADVDALLAMQEAVQRNPPPTWEHYVGKPTPVDAPPMERLKENWAQRKRLCIYDQQMQSAPLIHFAQKYDNKSTRMLVYFYAFLFFQDWNHDLWMKRFIRDHVRYIDEIQCAAARVVAGVREHARKRDPIGNPKGIFDAFHIRRGDFQYKATRIDADKIYEQTRKVIPENSTVFIGTDERDKKFFNFLKQHYDVLFLDDFHDVLGGVNTNYYGMIDALITSRGRYFFGCWFSTFTGYINRIRGYHADNEKYPGYEEGIIPSWYYTLPDRFDHHQKFYPVKQSFFAREFPTSWRLIDTGMEAFHAKQDMAAEQ